MKTAEELAKFASEKFQSMKIIYVPSEEIENNAVKLKERFKDAKRIKDTQQLHHYSPISTDQMKVKTFSMSTTEKIVEISE